MKGQHMGQQNHKKSGPIKKDQWNTNNVIRPATAYDHNEDIYADN